MDASKASSMAAEPCAACGDVSLVYTLLWT
jgi:hypothetical protein